MNPVDTLIKDFEAIRLGAPNKNDAEKALAALQLATSLKKLHDQNIAHRDICCHIQYWKQLMENIF